MELQSIASDTLSLGSLRSSLDEECFHRQHCDVIIYDNVPQELEGSTTANGVELQGYSRHRVSEMTGPVRRDNAGVDAPAALNTEAVNFQRRLLSRDLGRTRWINIIGWSKAAVDAINNHYLGNHGCLELESLSQQLIGGPVKAESDVDFIWIQTQMWFIGDRARSWSSLRALNFRMIVCLPTATRAGTIITNFAGPFRLAEEVSANCERGIVHNHPLAQNALGCVWILCFGMLRMMAEQLNFAFEVFDPTEVFTKGGHLPRLSELPRILEKANNIARISRYLYRLEEFTSFFRSSRNLLRPDELQEDGRADAPYAFAYLRKRADFEAARARDKILHEQKLCKSYKAPFDNLIQMMISYSTTQITYRLDNGRSLAERIAKIGTFLAALAAIVAPLSLLTSFYGMNMQEFTMGAQTTLYEFWKIGIPILLFALVGGAFLALWLFIERPKR